MGIVINGVLCIWNVVGYLLLCYRFTAEFVMKQFSNRSRFNEVTGKKVDYRKCTVAC